MLTGAVHRFADTEYFGTEHQTDCLSSENQRVVEMLTKGLKKLKLVGYEAPILWKEGEPQLMEN